MASREPSTRRKPSEHRPQQTSTATGPRVYSRPTPTADRDRSPPKSKPSSPPAGDRSRDAGSNLRPSNSTRHNSSSTRVNKPSAPQPQSQPGGHRNRHGPVQTSTRRTSPQRRPSTHTGSPSRNVVDLSRKPSASTPATLTPKSSGDTTRIRPRATTPKIGESSANRGLERSNTGQSRRVDLERYNSGTSGRSQRDLERNASGRSGRSQQDLERNTSGRSGRSGRDLTRSGSGRQGIQTSPKPSPQTPPKSPPKPILNTYYKPFTPFAPIDQQAPRVRYADGGGRNGVNERPVNEHGQFMDQDKLVPLMTGSTTSWVMVPDTGSIMVCSKCKEPVNPFKPKRSHKNCR